jgi:hypothetical protein
MRWVQLSTRADDNLQELASDRQRLADAQSFLVLSQRVNEALEVLSRQLFSQQLTIIQEKLSIALQEILDQPIQLKATVQWRRDAAAVDFLVVRDGFEEDVLKGQGGSVANTVSVGLRMFALLNLEQKFHRRLLVLDEQDCWLQPDLVPRLVKIIHEAGQALNFQVIMISHHDLEYFRPYAQRIYRFSGNPDGSAAVSLIQDAPPEEEEF